MNESFIPLNGIKERFLDEYESIKNYIDLMADITRLPKWDEIENLFCVLEDYCIISDNWRNKNYKNILNGNPHAINQIFAKIYSELKNKMDSLWEQVKVIRSEGYLDEEHMDNIDRRVMFFPRVEYFNKNKKFYGIEDLEDHFNSNAPIMFDGANKELNEIFRERIKLGRVNLLRSTFIRDVLEYHFNRLCEALDTIDNFGVLMKVNDPENILNVYRQGFILLIASFDAAVFDMIKVLLDKRFFKYMVQFCKDGKVKYSELEAYDNFEQFKNASIEECLKGKYVKELINILKSLNLPWINVNYSRLIECLNRRNIHLHNQGRVDLKYLEKYNIFKFQENQIAKIDYSYFYETYDLCSKTIDDIYNWIVKEIN